MVLLFQAGLRHMRAAAKSFDQKKSGDGIKALGKASDIVQELLATLHHPTFPELCDRLSQVYMFVLGRIDTALLSFNSKAALEAARADRLDIRRTVELSADDEELLRREQGRGKGVVLVTGHIGSWELFARRIAALGFPCGTVAKEAQDPRLTALLERARTHSGMRVFWRSDPMSARQIVRFLHEGGILGFLIDQDTRVAGSFVPFFGRPAFTPRAAGDLAARLGAPMLFGCAHRVASGVHRIVVRRIEVERSGDRERDSLALTAAATREIEDEIRKRPDEWVWMHPRWRTESGDIAREKEFAGEQKNGRERLDRDHPR
jgi:KDO2-lipid IV(A) lauroyltransferase